MDGIWRSTGAGVRLSPAEANAAAESIDETALAMLQALVGEPEVPPAPIPQSGNPVVTSERRIDPAQDFAWATGQRAAYGSTAAAADGWEKFWLDEKVPALFGRTSRQAARGRERPYLEALLRQFEYEAGLLAVEGKTGIDTAWLRQQLDMPSDLAD